MPKHEVDRPRFWPLFRDNITSLGVTSESVMFSFSSKTGPEVSKTGLRLKINIVKMHINSQISREPCNGGKLSHIPFESSYHDITGLSFFVKY